MIVTLACPASPPSKEKSLRIVELAPQLRGDLDAIVMKALAKEPEDRYGSAEHLAEDLHRYQRGFPVTRIPPAPGIAHASW